MQKIRIKRNFGGSMPSILPELIDISLNFNKNNPRDFETGYRCIAYAFDGSRLISSGYNIRKTPGAKYKVYAEDGKITTHAEIMVIKDIIRNNLTDYVTDFIVIRGTDKLLNSKPCTYCCKFISKVFYNIRLWYYYNNSWKVILI